MALEAVDEAATEALKGPIVRTKALAACLALIANRDPGDRRVYDNFWKEIALPLYGNESRDFGRRQTINNLAGHIFYRMGRKRG